MPDLLDESRSPDECWDQVLSQDDDSDDWTLTALSAMLAEQAQIIGEPGRSDDLRSASHHAHRSNEAERELQHLHVEGVLLSLPRSPQSY
jgi:hypothetical protein